MKRTKAYVFSLIGASVAGGIVGVSLRNGQSSPESSEEKLFPTATFSKETQFLNDFFTHYYTTKGIGENFSEVKPYFTTNFANEQQRVMQLQRENLSASCCGKTTFLSTKSFFYAKNEEEIEAIADVKYRFKPAEGIGAPEVRLVRVKVKLKQRKHSTYPYEISQFEGIQRRKNDGTEEND